MNKQIIIFILLIGICFYSCKKKAPENITDILVIEKKDLPEKIIKYGDENYFEKCFLIKLQTNDDCLLRTITQLEVYENNIYIFDISQKILLKFDFEGNFICQIGSLGNSPEEYVAISSFYIDSYDKTINIIDPIKSEIKKYSLDGAFISNIKSNNDYVTFISRITEINEKQLFAYSRINWQTYAMYLILNKDDLSVKEELRKYPYKLDNQMALHFANQPFSFYKDKIKFSSIFI